MTSRAKGRIVAQIGHRIAARSPHQRCIVHVGGGEYCAELPLLLCG